MRLHAFHEKRLQVSQCGQPTEGTILNLEDAVPVKVP